MNRLKYLRNRKGESLEKIAKYLNVTIQTISNYENEKRDMTPDTILKLADYFEVTTDYLLGKTPNNELIEKNKIKSELRSLVKIPVIGKISAGHPILTQENIEGYLPIDLSIYGMTTSDELFFLKVSGQSMNMKVKNGDFALIHKQNYAEDGDIVVAIVNGDDEATLKKYKKLNEQFVLLEPMSTDSTIESITVDLKNTDFKIVGKAIGQFGKF